MGAEGGKGVSGDCARGRPPASAGSLGGVPGGEVRDVVQETTGLGEVEPAS